MTRYIRNHTAFAALVFLLMLFITACMQEEDTEAPVLRLNGPLAVTIDRGTPYVETGFMAFDNEDYDITNKVAFQTDLDTHRIGDYTMTYTSTDEAGNSSSATRVIHVVHSLRSLGGTYHSRSSFTGCPQVGSTLISQEYLNSNSLKIYNVVATSYADNYMYARFTTTNPGYELIVSYGRLPCSYDITSGLGTISDDGDSITFNVHIVCDFNPTQANIVLNYVRY